MVTAAQLPGAKGACESDPAHRGNARAPPGRMGRIHGEIETRHGTRALHRAALGEHLQEQAAAAAGVGDDALGLGFAQGSLDEMQMIAQNEAAIPLLHPVDRGRFRHIPVVGRIILLELFGCGLADADGSGGRSAHSTT